MGFRPETGTGEGQQRMLYHTPIVTNIRPQGKGVLQDHHKTLYEKTEVAHGA